jgi:hypothetical protein
MGKDKKGPPAIRLNVRLIIPVLAAPIPGECLDINGLTGLRCDQLSTVLFGSPGGAGRRRGSALKDLEYSL